MLSFYMDHHVPSAITAGLRRRGVAVLTAAEDGSAMLVRDLELIAKVFEPADMHNRVEYLPYS
jgi:hypothetical protein